MLNRDRFSWSPASPSRDRLCLVALPLSSSPARTGRGWGTPQHGPDPVASVTCHAHLKGGGKEEEKLCGQLTVSVKRSSFFFSGTSPEPLPPIPSALMSCNKKDGPCLGSGSSSAAPQTMSGVPEAMQTRGCHGKSWGTADYPQKSQRMAVWASPGVSVTRLL